MNTNYLVPCLLITIFTSIAAAQDISDNQWNSPSDEAFIEPSETIQLAAAETGILTHVHVKIGDAVQKDQLLFELDQSVLIASKKIAQAKAGSQAKLKAARIEFENKNMRLKQVVELARDAAATQEEVNRAHSDALIAEQHVQAIIEELQQLKLEIDRLDAQIESHRIKSPINGIVVELEKKVGEHVSNSNPVLATLVRLDTLRAIFHLPNDLGTKLLPGDSVTVYLPDSQQEAAAVVAYVAPLTRADSGRVRVDIEIPNLQRKYRSGLRCRIVKGPQRIASLFSQHR